MFIFNLYAEDDLNITIVDFTADSVSNYFISIFMWYTVVLLPFFVAIAIIHNQSSK